MPELFTDRLALLETAHSRHCAMLGKMPAVCVNAWLREEPFPTLLVGSVLLLNMKREWLISHILIEDEARRHGFATEIVQFYEKRLGRIGACWASESGRAFGRKYVERFGPRTNWQVDADPEIEAIIDRLIAERKAVPA